MATEADDVGPILRRMTALEELCTHMERTIEALDEVVLGQQQKIVALELRLGRLLNEMASLERRMPEERRLEDDKPPHY